MGSSSPRGLDKGDATPGGLPKKPAFRYFQGEQHHLKPGVTTIWGFIVCTKQTYYYAKDIHGHR